MDKDGKIEKIDKVLIEQQVHDHFRDPQIFNYKGNITLSSVDKIWIKKELSNFIKLKKTTTSTGPMLVT